MAIEKINTKQFQLEKQWKGVTPKINIWVISYKANTMKTDGDSELLIKFADWIYDEYC